MQELINIMISIIRSEANTMKVYSFQFALADEARIAGFKAESDFIKAMNPRDSFELAEWLEVF